MIMIVSQYLAIYSFKFYNMQAFDEDGGEGQDGVVP